MLLPGLILLVMRLVLAAALICCACRSREVPQAKPRQIGWRPVESWSGSGSTQTEPFDIGSSQWRIKWQTRSLSSSAEGTFRVVVHSAVSGREMMNAIEHRGAGSGTAYVTEDPHLFHLVIESKDVDWSISVEEGVVAAAPI